MSGEIAIAVSFSLGFFHSRQKNSSELKEAKICNGKTKGLGTLPIYIREPRVVFHCWRRRDPPGWLRGDDFHLGFEIFFTKMSKR